MRAVASMIPVLPLLAVLGCGGTKPGDTANANADTGTDFCAVQSLFNASCTTCHSATLRQGDLDLQTAPYNAILNVTSPNYLTRTYVTPGNADTSFLYLKMVDAQSSSEGGVMPTAGQLSSAQTDIIRTWINDGASSVCGIPDASTTRYHPTGYEDPTVHGMEAKFQAQLCTSCHGADLTGDGDAVSCDTCHTTGWRQDCTFCHGGSDNMTGAPPEDIDDSTTNLSFPQHTVHVEAGIHAEWDCVQCHTRPTDIFSTGHLFTGDANKGLAEVSFDAGLSSGGTYTAGSGSCDNIYCHGDASSHGEGHVSSGEATSCHMCHGDQTSPLGMSGNHRDHFDAGITCGECHSDVISGYTIFTDADRHVDGTIDVHLPSGMEMEGNECNGTCHREDHSRRHW